MNKLRLAISVPSGFHARELLIPLKPFLESDSSIEHIICITPGAPYREQLFSEYSEKFSFVENLGDCEAAPDLVITTTAGLDAADVPILQAARGRGIATLTFIASWDNVWKMERFKNKGKPYVLADQLVVWNRMMADHLLRVFPELRPEQVMIIGAPRFDYFWHTNRIPTQAELRAHVGVPNDDKKFIHVATTELYPSGYLVNSILRAIDQKQIPDSYVYLSVHPGGDIAKHQSYTTDPRVIVRYSFGRQDNAPIKSFQYNPSLKDIYMLVALFNHTDVLVNHSSTVALESLAADVPVINVKYGQHWDWWRWYRSMVYRDFQQHYRDVTADGATTVVKGERQLITALNTYIHDPSRDQAARKKTLAKMITTTDGSAAQQVFDVIKRTCNRAG